MRLEISNNNSTKYIRVVESIWTTDSTGKKVSRKKTIANIGPVSKFTDGKPDFEERLKKSFKSGTPLIEELQPYVLKELPLKKYSFQITYGSSECIGHPKLYAHCLLERILDELEINQVIRSYKGFSNIKYDLLGYIRLLIFGRILEPASKIATARQNDRYYEPITKDTYEYHIYDALDFIYNHRRQIFNRMNLAISKKFSRKTDVVFYDVTNFYYEIEEPDTDIEDENGNIIQKGIRKMGVSKENRKQPIVQMGLFMDNSGIPISYEMFSGNTLDHLTVKTALKNTVDNMSFDRFIFVGDRGMCSYTNLLHILSCGNGYIVSKSIAKSKAEDKTWIYDDYDYTVQNEGFKYKSKIITRSIKNENGNCTDITEKVVVYWDKRFYEKELRDNKSFLEFLEKLVESPASFRITATQSKAVRKFLKSEYLNAKTGEVLNASELRTIIDSKKIDEYKKNMGYYQIVSSELDMSEQEIIEIYHGLSRIEDQFRVMKGDLDTRPMHVSTPEHIEAHLAVCVIALTIMRIIQTKITDLGLNPKKDTLWSYGISAERIQAALNKWTVDTLPDDYYRFNNLDDKDLKIILDAFKIDIPLKLFRKAELKSIKTNIKITT